MTTNPLQLTDRLFALTGASSGIGRDTAVLLSQLGARLILFGRNEQRLEETLHLLEGTGHRCIVFDLSSTDDVSACLMKISAADGPLHGLVHCAGIHMLRPLRVLNRRAVDNIMQVNVNAAIELARGFSLRNVSCPGSSIVLLSSVAGLTGQGGQSAYAASKGAVVALTRALAVELAVQQIRVNCVAPGFVRTPMGEELLASLTPTQISALEGEHLLGFGAPRDVSHAIAFLLTDMARWITGSVLVVDGGYTAH